MAKRRRSSTRTKSKKRSSRRSRVKRTYRRARSRVRRGTKKHGKSIMTTITGIIPSVAVVQLLTHNQLSALGSNASMGDKAKTIINGLTGSIFDFNIFDDVPKAHFKFDIEGIFNQWTAIAVGTWIGGAVGKKFGLPKSSILSSFGKKLLMPSLLSGSLGKSNNTSGSGLSSPYFSNTSVNTNSVRIATVSTQSSGGVA